LKKTGDTVALAKFIFHGFNDPGEVRITDFISHRIKPMTSSVLD